MGRVAQQPIRSGRRRARQMSPEEWQGYLAAQRQATKAAAELLPTVVRLSFQGGPLHRREAVRELPAALDGRMIEVNLQGHVYRSVVPWRKRASAIVLVHAASAWPRKG